jgi:hypothetical protein
MRSDADQRLIDGSRMAASAAISYAGEKQLYWGGKPPAARGGGSAEQTALSTQAPDIWARSPVMVRDHDALVAAIEARVRTAFAWDGTGIDCVRFAAEAVEAQTGEDRFGPLGLTWSSERTARRILKRLGGLEAAVDSVLRPVALAMARRGDVALVAGPTGPALMIIEGDSLVGPGERGQTRLSRTAMTKAWSAD